MAARRKKAQAAGLTGEVDPRAPLAGDALLALAKPLLKELAADLLARADGSPAVTVVLKARHAEEHKAERTADAYPEWRRAFAEQVAAAWLLSCVFVRTLEDRGLLGRARIAGTGAEDSWKAFLQFAPSLSEREYLLMVFRELSRLPAAADLFDAGHNPVWLLAPSAEGARKLLELFRSPNAESPAFRFGGDDTRFLGDLYQDLSEDVRKRFALLQTPRFVERFILDRTLDPAIERFGLDEATLIDPTCGSGHFLLGAFERLFDRRLHAEPGLSAREAATKALDAIAGADINPYAIAIARFRLTLAFLEKCGIARLKDAPHLPLHLAVADSLLYNRELGQLALVEGTDPTAWEGAHFALEDPKAARDVLFQRYAAVVGNPPYITVKDAVLRDRYRAMYSAAYREYSLGVPFMQRFFQLGRDGASVGMITANSFMKREFGKRLIEEFLPTVNLELIVNTSGAFIPGHGTPTVLLFGTRERAKGVDVLAVLASRGEPSTPEDAEKGLVWSSIAAHWSEVGFENEYISVARVDRSSLGKHPWSLGGGGASELKELLEERASHRLTETGVDIGTSAVTREDDVYLVGSEVLERHRVAPQFQRHLVIGEEVRDWAIVKPTTALWPYDSKTLEPATDEGVSRFLWPWKRQLSGRVAFGKTQTERGLPYTAYSMFFADRFRGPTIAFAFVATHNHFVLDRGGKVFNRSAPIIKLPETATEDDHLALLAYLNSSTACFWMKQVLTPKGSTSANRNHPDPARAAYEFAGTALLNLPLPANLQELAPLAREAAALANQRASLIDWATLETPIKVCRSVAEVEAAFARTWLRWDQLRRRLVFLQEEIDWNVYLLFGLASRATSSPPETIAQGQMARRDRAFADNMRTSLVRHDGALLAVEAAEVDTVLDDTDQAILCVGVARRAETAASPQLSLIETPVFKRLWRDTERNIAESEWRASVLSAAVSRLLLGAAERTVRERGSGVAKLDPSHLSLSTVLLQVMETICDADIGAIFAQAAVPFLAAHRYTDGGVEKHAAWERVWDLQRRKDKGEEVAEIPIPPKYDQKDFRDSGYYRQRGVLDVPKERFISYPGCESDEDHEPVYGWAGWDHLQRAVALAGLYQDRRQREGWTKERLMPMLAGLLELLPWLKQWHSDPSAELGAERPCDQFEAFLNAECSEHGWTHDDLRAWRPATARRGRAKQAAVEEDAES